MTAPSKHGTATARKKTDEQTIRDLDKEWLEAAQKKDARSFVSFYSDTGSAMPFNAPIATGRTNVQELWTQLMAKPGFALSFAPTRIEVAQSKDIAFDVGTFELKLANELGALMSIPGKYVVVWKKQKEVHGKPRPTFSIQTSRAISRGPHQGDI